METWLDEYGVLRYLLEYLTLVGISAKSHVWSRFITCQLCSNILLRKRYPHSLVRANLVVHVAWFRANGWWEIRLQTPLFS